MRKIICIIIILTSIITCKKYDEGPAFSLRTKKQRLSRTWQYQTYFENGVDKTATQASFYQNYIIGLGKDGSYSVDYIAYGQVPFNEVGIWEFDDEKEKIIFTRQFPAGNPFEWKIKRLKRRELWVEENDTVNNLLRLHQFIAR